MPRGERGGAEAVFWACEKLDRSPGELVKTPASDRVADALDLPAAAERIS